MKIFHKKLSCKEIFKIPNTPETKNTLKQKRIARIGHCYFFFIPSIQFSIIMQLNGLLFPAPPCSYTKKSQNLIWIPSNPIHTPAYQLKALCQKNRLHQTTNMEAKNKNINSSIFSSPLSPFLRCLCLQQTDSDVDENIYLTKNTTENLKHEKRSHSSLNCSTLITPTIRSLQESNIQQNRIAQNALTPPRRIHKMSSF